MDTTTQPDLRALGDDLLAFGRAAQAPDGAFGWLDRQGRPTPGMPWRLYVCCRMTYVYSLAAMAGRGGRELAEHGIRGLTGIFQDAEEGGWFAEVGESGPVNDTKAAYPHSFVVLAAAAATTAGIQQARQLLDEALAVQEEHFWDETTGLVVEQWDRGWRQLDPYRGLNSNMHTVEAYLAAFDATGERKWLDRAARITNRVLAWAAEHQGRIPEHFDTDWRPLLEHNAEHRDDPVRPYGSTPGHWFEWARLALHLRAGQHDLDGADGGHLLRAARNLFSDGVREAWNVDGEPGLIFTVDFAGEPVVRKRMHWVHCEAIAAAEVLAKATGEVAYTRWADRWWRHANQFFVDTAGGSWNHELDELNRPSQTIRPGKADLYHAYQATLFRELPVRASVARAVAEAAGA
ncbi:MAG: AGE family epimerase/isomerase [Brooklawnia sp.]